MLSGSIGRRTKDIYAIATGNRWYLTALAVALSILIVFGVDRFTRHYFVSASASNLMQSAGMSIPKEDTASQDAAASASTANGSNNSSWQNGQSGSQDVSTETHVNINGANLNASTNSDNPDQSIDKTIVTDGGSANVSIQQHSSVNSEGQKNSSASVQVNSESSSSGNTSIHVNQHSSGGSD
jgi:hypothetical protein